ncbi:MAG: efflux RND transporter periplasmic adaptor subunit [Ktedonobacteraceae bacterium]
MAEIREVAQKPEPLITEDQVQTDFVPQLVPLQHSRRRGWIIALVLLLLILVIGGGGASLYLFTRPPAVQYIQQTASIGNLTETVSATGPIQPQAAYNMNFTTTGQVSAIDVHIGQQVTAGQTIAQINSPSLQDQVTSAQQKVTSAQVAYNDAVTYGASQSVLDQDSQNIISAQDTLKAAQDALAATTMQAPGNATVAAINGAVGQLVGSGSGNGGGQPFIVLENTSTLTIAAQVNEADIAQVQTGQTATFTVPAYPSQTFNATVSTIETVGQVTSNVVNYTVALTVNQSNLQGAHLYPGMTTTVNIVTAKKTGVLLVPSTALSFPGTAVGAGEINSTAITSLFANTPKNTTPPKSTSTSKKSKRHITGHGNSATPVNRGVVLELQNGKLIPVLVTIGLSNGQYTQVLSGLSAGDQVVVGQTGGNTSTQQSLNTPLPRGAGAASKRGKVK